MDGRGGGTAYLVLKGVSSESEEGATNCSSYTFEGHEATTEAGGTARVKVENRKRGITVWFSK